MAMPLPPQRLDEMRRRRVEAPPGQGRPSSPGISTAATQAWNNLNSWTLTLASYSPCAAQQWWILKRGGNGKNQVLYSVL